MLSRHQHSPTIANKFANPKGVLAQKKMTTRKAPMLQPAIPAPSALRRARQAVGSGWARSLRRVAMVTASLLLGFGATAASAQSFQVTAVTFNTGTTIPVATGSTVTISYTCINGPCNGVQMVYQAAFPEILVTNPITVGLISGLAGALQSAVTNMVANTLTINLNSIASGAVSTITFPVSSRAGSTAHNTVSQQTLTTTSTNAGSDLDLVDLTFTGNRPTNSAIYGPATAAQGAAQTYYFEVTDGPLGPGSASSLGSPGARTLVGPFTLTYTAPANAVIDPTGIGTVCSVPIGREFARNTAGAFLPAPVTVIPGVIAAQTVTWTNTDPSAMLIACSTDFYDTYTPGPRGAAGQLLSVRVTYPAASFPAGTVVPNTFSTVGTQPGGVLVNLTATAINTEVLAPNLAFNLLKSRMNCGSNGVIAPQIPAISDFSCWGVTAFNTTTDPLKAPVTLDEWVLTDTMPPGTRLTQVNIGSPRSIGYKFEYDLVSNPGVFLSTATSTVTVGQINLCAPSAAITGLPATPALCTLPAPTAWVNSIRITIPGPIFANETASFNTQYQQMGATSTGATVATGDSVNNSVAATATSAVGLIAPQGVSVADNIPAPSGGSVNTFNFIQVPLIGVGSTLICNQGNIQNPSSGPIGNLATNTGPLVNPVLFISLPKDMANFSLVGGTSSGAISCTGMPNQSTSAPTISGLLANYQGSGRSGYLVQYYGTTLLRGCSISTLPLLQIRADMTVNNVAGPAVCDSRVFSDPGPQDPLGPWDAVKYFAAGVRPVDAFDFNNNGDTTEQIVVFGVDFTFPSQPAMGLSKSFSAASAEPGATITTSLILTNTGNDTMTAFDIVDVLPASGDANFSGLPRSSTAALQLTGAIVGLPTGVTATYSTDANPCRTTSTGKNPVVPGAAPVAGQPVGCTLTTWNAAGAVGSWPAIKSIRLVGTGQTLQPFAVSGAVLTLNIPVQVSPAATAAQIANNDAGASFGLNIAGTALSQAGSNTAALNIVVSALSGRVFNDLDSGGTQGGGELGLANFVVSITCTAGPCLTAPGGTTFSMLTNATGDYGFVTAAAGIIFSTANASGPAIASFPGLLSGTWSITETPPVAPAYTNVSRTVGTGPATVGSGAGRVFTGIVLAAGQSGINYNFGEILSFGTLNIQKLISGGPVGGISAGSFTFSVSCTTSPAIANQTITFGPLASTSQTIAASATVPAGDNCTVTELTQPAPPFGFTYAAIPVAVSTTNMPAGGSQTASLTNTLLANGSLQIQKDIFGAPVGGVSGAFTFSVTCTAGGPYADQTVTLAAATTGQLATPLSVPANATCSVLELTRPAPPAGGFAWTAIPAATGTTAMLAGGSQIAIVTNTLVSPGSLTINKTVTGGPAGGITGTFNFSVACTAGGPNINPQAVTLTNATSGNAVITGVPAGSVCTVNELAPLPNPPAGYAWGTLPPQVVTAAMAAGGTLSAGFSNTLQSGSLTINKTVSMNMPVTGGFSFTLACTNQTAGVTAIAAANTTQTITVNGGSATNSVIVTPIAAGSTCSVTEAAPAAIANYTWGATPAAATGISVLNGGNPAVPVANTLTANPGTLTVTKTITPAAPSVSGNFPFTVACLTPGATYNGTVNVAAGNTGSTTVSLPVGSTSCTVAETLATRATAPAGYAWGAPSVTQPNAAALPAGGTATTAISNPLQSGSLIINKTVTIPLPVAATFNFTVNCVAPVTTPATTALGAGVSASQSIIMAANATTGSITVGPIAAGSTCSVIETAPAAITNYKWGTTPVATSNIVIANSATPTAVPVTNVLAPLDPPFISKRSRLIDATTVEWTITVINNSAANAGQGLIAFNVTDAIPGNATIVAGSVACTPTGTPGQTAATSCGFNPGNTNLSVTGTLGYTADTNAATASERIDIVFRGTVGPGQVLVNNACADLQNVADTPVCAQNIITTSPLPVPTLDARALAALMLLMLLAAATGFGQSRRRG